MENTDGATAPKRRKTTKGTRKINKQPLELSGISVQQEAYCRARAMGMSMREAVIAANLGVGVEAVRDWESPNNPRSNPKIIARIEELATLAQNNAILKSGLRREWVISRYMSVVERCMQAEPVRDNKGRPIPGEYTFNAAGANQALRALGDVLGIFKPPEKKPGDDYENLSDDDLARLARELAIQTGLFEAPTGDQTTSRLEQIIKIQALPKTT